MKSNVYPKYIQNALKTLIKKIILINLSRSKFIKKFENHKKDNLNQMMQKLNVRIII
jgi:hypothetical protein